MRKNLITLAIVMLCMCGITMAQQKKYDFEKDGLYYKVLEDGTLSIVSSGDEKKYKGDISIPEKVEHEGKSYVVTKIGYGVFDSCMELTNVTFPNTLKEIDMAAFYRCESLNDVAFPSSLERLGDNAFTFCHSMKKINIPKTLVDVQDGNFTACSTLVEINVEAGHPYLYSDNGVLLISYKGIKGVWAYPGGKPETSYTLPEGITHIGDKAFAFSPILKKVTLPESMQVIREYAFAYCTALEEINLPKSVVELRRGIFEKCDKLKKISVFWEDPLGLNDNNTPFPGLDLSKIKLYVPKNTTAKYKSAPIWQKFDIVEAESSVDEISDLGIEIKSGAGYLSITGDANDDIYIYTLRGELISRIASGTLNEHISLPKGVYIIKCGEFSGKAIAR